MTSALFSNVLVASDGSDSAAQAIERAALLVEASSGTLKIVGAVGAQREQGTLEEALAASAAALTARGINATVLVAVGDPVEVILDAGFRGGVDLIVLGNKGMTGARRFILGSVPDKVSHRATCSVMIARTV